jgi:hypothetical protein
MISKWLRQKPNQLFILFIGLSILIFNNLILRRHEQIRYHNERITNLTLKAEQLGRYKLHTPHHQAQQPVIEQQTRQLAQSISVWTTTKSLQTRLGQLQRSHHLEVIRQTIQESPLDETFGQIEVQQTLSGSYAGHVDYLKALVIPDSLLIIENVRFENTEPLTADPILTADLTLKTFYRIAKP